MSTGIPFIGEIFSQLQGAAGTQILAEILDGEVTGVTGNELLELVRKARTFIAARGLQKGDRCGLLAANSIRWVAMDLALMAEGLIVVRDLFHHHQLVRVRLAQNRVQCGHHWHLQAAQQMQNMASGWAAEDSVLVLQTHHVDVVEVQEVSRFLVGLQVILGE